MNGIEKSQIIVSEETQKIIEPFFCIKCKVIPYDPFLCEKEGCNTTICSICLKGLSDPNCPICFSGVISVKKVVSTLLSKLTLYCTYKENGCSEILNFSNALPHLQKCQYKVVKCASEKCNFHDLRLSIEVHQKVCKIDNEKSKIKQKEESSKLKQDAQQSIIQENIICETCGKYIKNNLDHHKICKLKKNFEGVFDKYDALVNQSEDQTCNFVTNLDILEKLRTIDNNQKRFENSINEVTKKLLIIEEKFSVHLTLAKQDSSGIETLKCKECKSDCQKSNSCCDKLYCLNCVQTCKLCLKNCCNNCCNTLSTCSKTCNNLLCLDCIKDLEKKKYTFEQLGFYYCQVCKQVFCGTCHNKRFCKSCVYNSCEKCFQPSCNFHTVIQIKMDKPIISYNDNLITNFPLNKSPFSYLSGSNQGGCSLLDKLKTKTEVIIKNSNSFNSAFNNEQVENSTSNIKFFDPAGAYPKIYSSTLGSINEFDIVQNKISNRYENIHEGNIKSIVKLKENFITCSFDGLIKMFENNFNNKIWEYQVNPIHEISQLIVLNEEEFACVTSNNKSALSFNINNLDNYKLKLNLDCWLLTLDKFHADLVLLGGNDSHIYYWSISTNSIINKISAHKGSLINYILKTNRKNPNLFASSGQDKKLNLWDINGQNLLCANVDIVMHWYSTIKEHYDGRIITGSNDYSIKLLDINSKDSTKFTYHKNYVYDFLSINEYYFLSGSSDYHQCLWDTRKNHAPLNHFIYENYPLRFLSYENN